MKKAADRAPRLRIRRARAGDAAALARLSRAFSADLRETVSKFTATAAARDVIGRGRILDAVVAELDGKVVGFAFWHDGYERPYAARGVFLSDLYVAPAARRHGVGRALMEAVARAAKRRGRTYMWWTSKPWNTRAHAFYRAIGAQIREPLIGHAIVFDAFQALAAPAGRRHGAARETPVRGKTEPIRSVRPMRR